MTKVKCHVTDCIYNNDKYKVCTLNEIDITDSLVGDAECCNFEILENEPEDDLDQERFGV